MKNIIFIRHGKAGPTLWPIDTPEDHTNRHLANLGEAQARDVAAWLTAHGISPDHVLCSTATRTTETCKHVLDAMNAASTPTTFHSAIYYGEVDVIMDAIRKAPTSANTLFVIGHNPTLPMTAQFLDAGNNADLHDELYHRFNLAAVAWVEVADNADWAGLTAGSGRLRATYEPIQSETLGNTSAMPL